MNDADHFLTSDYLDLTEDQKEALINYISTLHNKPVEMRILDREFTWVCVVSNAVRIWSTFDYDGYNLLSKQELLECVAMGMLV